LLQFCPPCHQFVGQPLAVAAAVAVAAVDCFGVALAELLVVLLVASFSFVVRELDLKPSRGCHPSRCHIDTARFRVLAPRFLRFDFLLKKFKSAGCSN
jgi:hypothetical protein